MSWVAAAVAGGTIVGGILSSNAQGDAAQTAADAQTAASQAGIAQQNKQFEAVQALLQPYVSAGTGALSGQQNLLGLNGNDAQAQAIAALQSSPQFTSLLKAGNDNILQNASATGGLRGGNTQNAIAQFSPQLLNQLIDTQYSRLAGLSSTGENAAAGVGNAGVATGNNITSLLGQQGAASAGAALAQGRATAGIANSVSSGIGSFAGLGGFGSFGSQVTPAYAATTNGIGTDATSAGNYYGNVDYSFSDARLKTDIRRIGSTSKGNPLYEWTWKASGKKGRGVLAQEVAHIPGAVAEDPCTGFLAVNYRFV